jgi:hypothetical protein
MKEIREETLRKRAYFIWERRGRPEGSSDAHWLEAIAELGGRPRFPGWGPEHSLGPAPYRQPRDWVTR